MKLAGSLNLKHPTSGLSLRLCAPADQFLVVVENGLAEIGNWAIHGVGSLGLNEAKKYPGEVRA